MTRAIADLLAECGRCKLTICDTEEFGIFVRLRAPEFPNAARMARRFPRYVTSPIDPAHSAIVKQPSRPDDLNPLNPFIDYAKSLVPFSGVVSDATDTSKYKSKAPGALRAGLGLLGAYTTNNESAFERHVLDRMEQTGDDRFKATQYVSKMHRRR